MTSAKDVANPVIDATIPAEMGWKMMRAFRAEAPA
jgi:hypothetical protein